MIDWSRKHLTDIGVPCYRRVGQCCVRRSLTWHSWCTVSCHLDAHPSLTWHVPPPQVLLGIFVVSFYPTLTPVTPPVEESPGHDAGDYEPLAEMAPDEQVCPEYKAGLYSSLSPPPRQPDGVWTSGGRTGGN